LKGRLLISKLIAQGGSESGYGYTPNKHEVECAELRNQTLLSIMGCDMALDDLREPCSSRIGNPDFQVIN
jgi:hypothetical protein